MSENIGKILGDDYDLGSTHLNILRSLSLNQIKIKDPSSKDSNIVNIKKLKVNFNLLKLITTKDPIKLITSIKIIGGEFNYIGEDSIFSSIIGGLRNTLDDGATRSTILGGGYNTITTGNTYSSIVGGYSNTVNHDWAVIIGGQNLTTVSAETSM